MGRVELVGEAVSHSQPLRSKSQDPTSRRHASLLADAGVGWQTADGIVGDHAASRGWEQGQQELAGELCLPVSLSCPWQLSCGRQTRAGHDVVEIMRIAGRRGRERGRRRGSR